jgi:hypothetical protein
LAEREKPWEFSASGWLSYTGVHEPWIAEISPWQYQHLSERGKRQYDIKRSGEWETSTRAKSEWRRLVGEAYEKGEITEQTPGLSEEAKTAIFWYKEEKEKQRELEHEKEKGAKLTVQKYEQALALKKSDFAKWWVVNSPRQVPGFEHVLRQEANNYWRAVHGEISPAVAQYVYREVEEAKALSSKNPRNPGRHTLSCKHGKCECVIREHPKEHFDPGSFRRVKDRPKPGYDMIVGCPKGEFRAGRCQVGTELHKIIAPIAKCK